MEGGTHSGLHNVHHMLLEGFRMFESVGLQTALDRFYLGHASDYIRETQRNGAPGMFPPPLREVLSFKEATGLVAASCVPRPLKDISKTREGKGQAEAQVGGRMV